MFDVPGGPEPVHASRCGTGKLTLNAKEFDETIVYTGKGAKESNFLAQKALSDEKFEMELEGLLEKDEATFKSALETKGKEDLAKLEGAGLDEKLVTVLKPRIAQEGKMLTEYYNQKAAAKKTTTKKYTIT